MPCMNQDLTVGGDLGIMLKVKEEPSETTSRRKHPQKKETNFTDSENTLTIGAACSLLS